MSGNIQAYGQVAPLADVSFNPTSLIFALQALDTVSALQTVTLTNTGTTALMLTLSVDTVYPYATDFTLVNHCPASLAINVGCTVDVSFAPVGNGYPHTNLVINGATSPRYIDLSGSTPRGLVFLLGAERKRMRLFLDNSKGHFDAADPEPIAAEQLRISAGADNSRHMLFAGPQHN